MFAEGFVRVSNLSHQKEYLYVLTKCIRNDEIIEKKIPIDHCPNCGKKVELK
jgi:DNA-directed RNA polymerase subunit RPC12/RpoP